MPQADVVLHPRAPEVEVAVAQADLFGHRCLVRDRKRRRLRFSQNPDLACEHFHFAGRELRVDRVLRSPLHDAADPDDELRPQALGRRHQGLVVAHDDLRQPGAVADIDECHTAEIADAVNPSKQHRLRANIVRAQGAAGMGSSEIA